MALRDPRVNWWWLALLAGVGVVVTLLAYRPGLEAGFYFDDLPNIVEATALHWTDLSLDGLREVVSDALIPRRWLANSTFALNHVTGRLDPHGYHWLNLLIHIAVGVSLVWVAILYARPGSTSESSRSVGVVACVVSLLFLLHPLNIQAVTYVVQRMSSLAALFCLGALGGYLAGRQAATTLRAVGLYLLALAAWVLALGSKENALILPLVVVTYELSFHRREWAARIGSLWRGRHRWIIVVSVVGVAIAGYWVYSVYLGSVHLSWDEVLEGREFTGRERVLTQARVQLFYLGLLLWPAPARLNLEHDFAISRALLDPASTAIALVVWLVVLAAGLYLIRRRPRYGFPLLAYMLFHAIESGPVNLELVFEHRMYLPMTALMLLLVVAVVDLGERRRSLMIVIALTLAVPLAVATHRRNVVWSNNIGFHYDCALKSPGKFRPQLNLGIELGKAGRAAEAIPFFRTAIELRPDSGKAHNQLGSAHLRLDQLDLAYPEFRAAVLLDPENAYAQYNLAWVLDRTGRGREAAPHYRQFLLLDHPKLANFRSGVERRLRELTAAEWSEE